MKNKVFKSERESNKKISKKLNEGKYKIKTEIEKELERKDIYMQRKKKKKIIS